MNASTEPLLPKTVAQMYLKEPTLSDVATTSHVLKIFTFLGLVAREEIYKGKLLRFRFRKLKNIKVPNGIATRITKVNETKPAEIKCPVVENYRRRFIPQPSNLPLKYNPNLSLQEVKTFWILSALKHCNGSYTAAAKLLGIGRETVYRLVRELND